MRVLDFSIKNVYNLGRITIFSDMYTLQETTTISKTIFQGEENEKN